MNAHEARSLISILMESPLYLHLSLKERSCLLSRLISNYPCLLDSRCHERDEKKRHDISYMEQESIQIHQDERRGYLGFRGRGNTMR